MILTPQTTARHALMDVGRGFAILGVLCINIFVFALPFEVIVMPAAWGEWNALNTAVWDTVSVAIAGVMRGMIAILFGASALLLLYRAEKSGPAFEGLDRFFRRLLWLIVFGLVHGYILLWPHDILYVYGVLGLLIFPFRNLDVKWLSVLACLMFAGSVVTNAYSSNQIEEARSKVEQTIDEDELQDLREGDPLIENYDDFGLMLNDPHSGAVVHLASSQTAPNETKNGADADPEGDKEVEELVERIGKEIEERQMGYFANVKSQAEHTFAEQTQEMFTTHFFDVGSFFIIGMLLLRTGFLTCEWSSSAYVRFMMFGYLIGLVLGLLDRVEFEEGSAMELLASSVAQYTYDFRRLAFALAYFSTLALALKTQLFVGAINVLSDCGRIALSLYVGQTVVCNLVFLGFGLRQFGMWEHYEIATLGIFLTALQCLIASIYLKKYRQGPLEWLLRTLIDGGSAGAGITGKSRSA